MANTKQTHSGTTATLESQPNSAIEAPPKPTKRRAKQQEMAREAKDLQAEVVGTIKQKRGQPTKFSRKLWEEIIDYIACYGDIIEICQRQDMPAVSTVRRWYRDNPELKDEIREAWIDASFLGHSVNTNILRGGVLSTGDFRRDEALVKGNSWFMSKTNRRDFGDRQTVDLNQTVSVSIPAWATALPTPSDDGEVIDADAIYEAETVKRLTSQHKEDE